MLDCDLAELYGVETKVFNQAVKRNEARFPPRFRFQLTAEEYELLRSQTVTSKARGGRRYLPYAFTEQGIAMLSAILRSETAVEVSIKIIDEFVAMRRFLVESSLLLERVQNLELSQRSYQRESDEKITRLFKLLEEQPEDGQCVFFAGQLFDAFSLFVDLVQQASAEIVLVDAYVDVSTLNILAKKRPGVDVTVYTNRVPKSGVRPFPGARSLAPSYAALLFLSNASSTSLSTLSTPPGSSGSGSRP